MENIILELKNIVKVFPGVKALDDVSFSLKKGSIHALVGENGAGKTTLMMVLGGVYKQDSGEIYIEGNKVSFESAHDAIEKGVSVVFQELSLVPNLMVSENIFANRQPTRKLNLINWNKLNKDTHELLKKFGMQDDISPQSLVSDLSMAKRQVIEILKALSINPKILILDEPTSSLTEKEVKELFTNIIKLKEQGISIIYISHHLKEIFEVADTVTVLRDGKHVVDAMVKDIDEDFLVANMVGRKIINIYGERSKDDKIGDVFFEAANLKKRNLFENINFNIKKGEIVGFAGLVGAGRTELGRAIFGAEPADSGDIILDGKKISIKQTKQAIFKGIGYLSEDRKNHGLYLGFDVKDNIISNQLSFFTSRTGFLKKRKIESYAKSNVKQFNIATPSIYQIVNNLSGGNQQKLMVASWFGTEPKLLIADEPTRGVDIGAKNDIYNLLRSYVAKGNSIMLISSDLPEIIGLSDRVYVMKNGKIAGELSKENSTEENIISLATGIESKRKGNK
ncbi:MAG: sugar ABC transporter ATP-binding protein [Candidatus Humimicrobiaceae bacterium]